MATKVDELIIEIKAETKKLRDGLSQVDAQLKRTNKSAKGFNLTLGRLGYAALALAAVQAGKKITQTTKMFEDLEATLRANSKSAEETAAALDMIKRFTAQTTFQVEEVTAAFIELKRKGISATEAELRGLGNIAAANNVSIEQVAMGVTRAATTSIEQLQMLGFTGKSSGDQITLSYGEGAEKISRTFKKTTANVMSFVASLGEDKFGTAIADRANTVTGAFSNLGDATSEFMNKVGEAGLRDVLVKTSKALKDMATDSEGAAVRIGQGIKYISNLFSGIVSIFTHYIPLGFKIAVVGLVKFQLSLIQRFEKIRIHAREMANSVIESLNSITPDILNIKPLDLAPDPARAAQIRDFLNFIKNAEADIAKQRREFAGESDPIEVIDPTPDKKGGDIRPIEGQIEGINSLKEAYEALKPTIAEVSQAMGRELSDALISGENAFKAFASFAKSIVNEIIATIMNLMVIQPIIQSVLGALNIPINPTAAASAPISPPMAGGGTVQANRPVLVGERGAEVFVPNSSGRIVNNANAQNMVGSGGGTVVNQNISFSTGVVPTVRAEIVKLMPQIAQVTKAAVAEGTVRGGSFRKAIQGG